MVRSVRLICAMCPACLKEHGKTDGDSCPFHFPSQVAPENPAVGFHCEHHNIKLVRTKPKKKRKRKKK
jgi:hypothetical protein